MTRVFDVDSIRAAAKHLDVVALMERAFKTYSEQRSFVGPVGHLSFDEPPGDTCIKYGYERGAETFVVKVASGFYDNPRLGLPASTGLMLVFSQHTGIPRAVLLDEGYLTDLRTGAAGAVAAKHMAPAHVDRIGIVGTGTQARHQLRALRHVLSCTDVAVYGRDSARTEQYALDMKAEGFDVQAVSLEQLAESCRLIVTTTPSSEPLLTTSMVRPGTHLTAVGADSPGKGELEAGILGCARHVVADSVQQCSGFGEVHRALASGDLAAQDVKELGNVIADGGLERKDSDITVADLTGVAIQDVVIATAICEALEDQRKSDDMHP